MEQIRKQVLQCLDKFADDDNRLITELELIIEQHGKLTYRILFHILTNLDLTPSEAKRNWHLITDHRQDMTSSMGRDVSLRTAVCDYFCTINKSLRNPKVIEIHLFEKTAQSSKYDSLTGLLNRRSFDEALEQELSRANRHDIDLSVLFIDLDDFKRINDTYGHPAGDKVLKKLGEIITAEKRTEDIAARYGGEEFALILPGTEKTNALVPAERIRRKLEKTKVIYDGQIIQLTLSGGLAAFPIDADNSADLLKNADAALYRSKEGGKNTISLFSSDKRRNVRVDLNSEIKFRKLDFSDSRELSAKIKSISIGGILFESDRPLEIGSKIQLNMILDQKEPLLAIGTVIRVKVAGNSRYDISISFIETDQATKNEISKHLTRYMGTATTNIPQPFFMRDQRTSGRILRH